MPKASRNDPRVEEATTLWLHIPAEEQAKSARYEAGPGQELQSNSEVDQTPVIVPSSAKEKSIVPQQWRNTINTATTAIAQAISTSPLGFTLQEVELSFSVGSDGLLGLITGVKAEGAIKLTFKPPSSPGKLSP